MAPFRLTSGATVQTQLLLSVLPTLLQLVPHMYIQQALVVILIAISVDLPTMCVMYESLMNACVTSLFCIPVSAPLTTRPSLHDSLNPWLCGGFSRSVTLYVCVLQQYT